MPLAGKFVSSILEFCGWSEDIHWCFVPSTYELYEQCFAQVFKRRKDFTAIPLIILLCFMCSNYLTVINYLTITSQPSKMQFDQQAWEVKNQLLIDKHEH